MLSVTYRPIVAVPLVSFAHFRLLLFDQLQPPITPPTSPRNLHFLTVIKYYNGRLVYSSECFKSPTTEMPIEPAPGRGGETYFFHPSNQIHFVPNFSTQTALAHGEERAREGSGLPESEMRVVYIERFFLCFLQNTKLRKCAKKTYFSCRAALKTSTTLAKDHNRTKLKLRTFGACARGRGLQAFFSPLLRNRTPPKQHFSPLFSFVYPVVSPRRPSSTTTMHDLHPVPPAAAPAPRDSPLPPVRMGQCLSLTRSKNSHHKPQCRFFAYRKGVAPRTSAARRRLQSLSNIIDTKSKRGSPVQKASWRGVFP